MRIYKDEQAASPRLRIESATDEPWSIYLSSVSAKRRNDSRLCAGYERYGSAGHLKPKGPAIARGPYETS